jgi:hypothetical protein
LRKPSLYSFCVIIGLLSILYSCSERISIDLDNSYTRLVVYGEITTQRKAHKIRLTRTENYYNNKPPAGISGAYVSIQEDATEIILKENDSIPGVYETDPLFYGKPGKTYILRIEKVDVNNDGILESYSATSYLPPVSQIDSIRLSYLSNSFISGWQVLLYALDPPGRKDYYVFKVYKNNKLLTDSLSEYIFQSDEFFNGKYTNGIVSQFLNDNKPDEKASEGDVITFELNAITEDYLRFLIEAQSEISIKIPLFSGPPANVKSNLSNNAVGYFTTYSISKASTIVPAKQ